MSFVINIMTPQAPTMYVGRTVNVGPFYGRLPKKWKVFRLIDARQWSRRPDAEHYARMLSSSHGVKEKLYILEVAERPE